MCIVANKMVHLRHMTVREAVRFSTALRSSPRLPERAVDHHVRLILHLLNVRVLRPVQSVGG